MNNSTVLKETKYTFLLPAYKKRFFSQALESIKNQTFRDFQVIVSDDHSPEDLFSVFSEVCGNDNRFSFRRNEKNMGAKSLVSHWNMLVELCNTEFFIMAGDDDIYSPTFLEEIDSLTCIHENVDIIRGKEQRINSFGEVMAKDGPALECENQIDALYGFFNLRRIHCIGNFAFRTAVFIEKGLFDDFPMAWGSDDTAYMKMTQNGICETQNIVFSFRLSDINISGTAEGIKIALRSEARMQNLLFFEQFKNSVNIEDCLLSKTRFEEFCSFFTESWIRQIREGLEYSNWQQFKKMHTFLRSRNAISSKFDTMHLLYTWFRARNARIATKM